MSTVPYAIVRARRVTGWLLLSISVLVTVALALGVTAYLNAPRTVRPVAAGPPIGASVQPQGGTSSSSASSVATAPTPAAQLDAYRSADAAAVAAVPDGYWVAQLASNRVGTDRDGRTWDAAAILADHENRRSSHGAALLWSGDIATYDGDDYWVTIVPSQTAGSPEPVLSWCSSQGIDRDHCVAKRIGRTSDYSGPNTRYQR